MLTIGQIREYEAAKRHATARTRLQSQQRVLSKILSHLQAPASNQVELPASQAPPTGLLIN